MDLPLQVDFLLSRLKVLYERIDDTEDLINIELDHRSACPKQFCVLRRRCCPLFCPTNNLMFSDPERIHVSLHALHVT